MFLAQYRLNIGLASNGLTFPPLISQVLVYSILVGQLRLYHSLPLEGLPWLEGESENKVCNTILKVKVRIECAELFKGPLSRVFWGIIYPLNQ